MKKLLALVILATTILAGSAETLKAQVVVKVKPVRPAHVVMIKPTRVKQNHIWVSGHWKWNAKRKTYVWADGYYVKKRRGYRYVTGEWVIVGARGYKWVPGHWVRV